MVVVVGGGSSVTVAQRSAVWPFAPVATSSTEFTAWSHWIGTLDVPDAGRPLATVLPSTSIATESVLDVAHAAVTFCEPPPEQSMLWGLTMNCVIDGPGGGGWVVLGEVDGAGGGGGTGARGVRAAA